MRADAQATALVRASRGRPQKPDHRKIRATMTRHMIAAGFVVASLALAACGPGAPSSAEGPSMPRFDSQELAEGRSIWMGTCRACHLLGVAGAPAVTDYENWTPRIAKGMPALYKGPIHGIKGDDGKYKMPPRAGNDRLSDVQIQRAADYMVAAVEHLHRQASGE
jgi:cytochrome c5